MSAISSKPIDFKSAASLAQMQSEVYVEVLQYEYTLDDEASLRFAYRYGGLVKQPYGDLLIYADGVLTYVEGKSDGFSDLFKRYYDNEQYTYR